MSDTIPMTIEAQYSCDACGLKRVKLGVPARGVEDVRDWMDATVRLVWQDHWKRSPRCRPTTLTELLIPVQNADRIGGPPTH